MNYFSNLASLAKRIESAGARICSALPHKLTPRAVDSVVGIDDSDAASALPSSNVAGASVDVSPVHEASASPATSAPKRSSGLGAVRKGNARSSPRTVEQQSLGIGSSDNVATDSTVCISDHVVTTPLDVTTPSPVIAVTGFDGAELLAPHHIAHATDVLACNETSVAAIQEAEPAAASIPIPSNVVAVQDGAALACVDAVVVSAATAAASAQATNDSTQLLVHDAAALDSALAAGQSNAHCVVDKLKTRELQLEVPTRVLSCCIPLSIQCIKRPIPSHLTLRVLVEGLGRAARFR